MAANSTEEEFLCPPRFASPHSKLLFASLIMDNSFSTEQHVLAQRNPSVYNPLDTFRLPPGQERQYQQQYGDMYFLRLAKLKPAVEAVAVEAWEGFSVQFTL